jgi:hypothetical protein
MLSTASRHHTSPTPLEAALWLIQQFELIETNWYAWARHDFLRVIPQPISYLSSIMITARRHHA